jgi:hypothetical protein
MSPPRLIQINVATPIPQKHRSINPMEPIMTTGEFLYLLMCLGMFFSFSVALAYASWLQSQMGPEMIGARQADERQTGHGDPGHGDPAHA